MFRMIDTFFAIRQACMDWTHRLRLRNLQMLLSLAQTGNMSQSANLLHTTQPGLSKWLRELEEDIGVQLFERMPRGVRPTSQGAALIAHARRLEAHLDTARDEMDVLRARGAGLVTVGFAGASSVDAVPMAVLRILQQLPQAHIRLLELRTEGLAEALGAGAVDIVVGPEGMPVPEPLIRSERLYTEPLHLVVRRNHPLCGLATPSWRDVLRYPWALWSRGTPVRSAFDAALTAAGQKPPATYVESNSAALTTTLLIHSDMIGVASHGPAVRWRNLNILDIIPVPLTVAVSVHMYWREDAAARVAVKTALDSIRGVVRDEFQEAGGSGSRRARQGRPAARVRR